MANNLSNFCQQNLLNDLFSKSPTLFGGFVSPPTLYVALCTAAPTNASTGATITEANYGSYARKATVAGDWNAATGNSPATTSNLNSLSFPAATSGSNTITHFAILDSATIGAGNMLLWGALSSSLVVSAGITPSFSGGSPGSLQVTVD